LVQKIYRFNQHPEDEEITQAKEQDFRDGKTAVLALSCPLTFFQLLNSVLQVIQPLLQQDWELIQRTITLQSRRLGAVFWVNSSSWPARASHIRAVPSQEAVSTSRPSKLNAALTILNV